MAFIRIAITFIALLVFSILLYPKMAAALLVAVLLFFVPKKSREKIMDSAREAKEKLKNKQK